MVTLSGYPVGYKMVPAEQAEHFVRSPRCYHETPGFSHGEKSSVRDQETTCASHFQPCWQCYRHKEGHEVAVVTLFMPVREDLAPSRALAQSFYSFYSSYSSCSMQFMMVRSCSA